MTKPKKQTRGRKASLEGIINTVNDAARREGVVFITCPNEECGYTMRSDVAIGKREIASHLVGGMRGVHEIGVLCPKCQTWEHSFFTNPNLRNLRQGLDKQAVVCQAIGLGKMPIPTEMRADAMSAAWKIYKKKKRAFTIAFDRFNKQMRRKHEISSPTE